MKQIKSKQFPINLIKFLEKNADHNRISVNKLVSYIINYFKTNSVVIESYTKEEPFKVFSFTMQDEEYDFIGLKYENKGHGMECLIYTVEKNKLLIDIFEDLNQKVENI